MVSGSLRLQLPSDVELRSAGQAITDKPELCFTDKRFGVKLAQHFFSGGHLGPHDPLRKRS
jgi:hypothetical protein